jgi:RHS repeat-associated protein
MSIISCFQEALMILFARNFFALLLFCTFPLCAIADDISDTSSAPASKVPLTNLPFDISEDGSYTTGISFEIPDFRDLSPKFGLRYSSASGPRAHEWAFTGLGWGLTGFSKIERVSLGGGIPTYIDGEDIFRLDGEDLLACTVGPNPWAPAVWPYPQMRHQTVASASCDGGGNLVTLRDNYARVVFDADANSFEVTSQSGVRRLYQPLSTFMSDGIGFTSSLEAQDRLLNQRVYLLAEIIDTQPEPNRISFEYFVAPEGEGYATRPKRVSFHSGGVTTPVYVLNWHYDTLPDLPASRFVHPTLLTAAYPTYATGTEIQGMQTNRLRGVSLTTGSGEKIRAYGIHYEQSAQTLVPLISKVDQFGSDFIISTSDNGDQSINEGTRLTGERTFAYSPDILQSETVTYPSAFDGTAIAFDLDRDGFDEIAFSNAVAVRSHRNTYDYSIHHESFVEGLFAFPQDRTASFRTVSGYESPGRYLGSGYADSNGTKKFTTSGYSPSHANTFGLAVGGYTEFTIDRIHVSDKDGDTSVYYRRDTHCTIETQKLFPLSAITLHSQSTSHTCPKRQDYFSAYEIGNFDHDPDPEVIRHSFSDERAKIFDLGANGELLNSRDLSDVKYLLRTVGGDFNGNGAIDLWKSSRNQYQSQYGGYRDTDLNRDTLVRIGANGEHYNLKYPNRFSAVQDDNRTHKQAIGDVNGDGISDVVIMEISTLNQHANAHVSVFLSNGNGFQPRQFWAKASPDFTGLDGPMQGKTASGAGSHSPLGERYGHEYGNISIRDMNGDGMGDLIVTSGHNTSKVVDGVAGTHYPHAQWGNRTAWVYLSDGTRFQPSTERVYNSWSGFADLDGNGLTDVLLEGENGRVIYNTALPPNKMVSETNRLGGRTFITYGPAAHQNDFKTPHNWQVVTSVTRTNGFADQDRVTDYTYVGARYDYDFRTSLGFRTVTATLPLLDGETDRAKRITTYLQDHAGVRGRVKSTMLLQNGETHEYDQIDWTVSATSELPMRAQKNRNIHRERWGTELVETVTTYDFDRYGRLKSEANLGLPGVEDDVTTRTWYHNNLSAFILDRAKTKVIGAGSSVENTSDRATKWRHAQWFLYDSLPNWSDTPTHGNLTSVFQWDGNPSSSSKRLILQQDYDSVGNIIWTKTPNGDLTSYGYDSATRLFQTRATNALGHEVTTDWSQRCAAPGSVQDANGLTTAFVYDLHCREIRQDLPSGDQINTGYSDFGIPGQQHIWQSKLSGSTLSDRDISKTTEYFDGFGQAYKTSTPGVTEAQNDDIFIIRSHDTLGRIAYESRPLSFNSSQSTSVPKERRTDYGYDPLGRLVRMVHPDGAERTIHRRTAQFTARNGQNARFMLEDHRFEECTDRISFEGSTCAHETLAYDAVGNIIRRLKRDSTRLDTNHGGHQTRETGYNYDLLGRLTEVVDPAGNTFRYTYDHFGNRVRTEDPGLGIWALEYDFNGNLTRQIDAKNQVIEFSYDALDRPVNKTVTADGISVSSQTLYDSELGVGTGYSNGQIVRMRVWDTGQTLGETNWTHQIQYKYGSDGQVVRETHKVDSGEEIIIGRTYRASGHLAHMDLPSDPNNLTALTTTPQLQYDASGRLTSFGSWVQNVTYNVWGLPTSMKLGDQLNWTAGYSGRRGWVNYYDLRNNNGQRVDYVGYPQRDRMGRVLRQNTMLAQGKLDFTYDYAGRLLSATNWHSTTDEFNQTFSYNRAGSIAHNSRVGDYAYDPIQAPAHVPAAITNLNGQTSSFAFDANGNMELGLGGKVMTYDGENRPLSVIHNGKETRYVYGADGKRLKVIEDGVETLFLGGVEIRSANAVGQPEIRTYPHDNVMLVNGTPQYLFRDQLQSVRSTWTAAAPADLWASSSRKEYRPFGEFREWGIPESPDKAFIGEYYDRDAELSYLNARYYDPKLGMFIQPDWFEVTTAGVGTNRYSYSLNDPVNLRDPNGNAANDWFMNDDESREANYDAAQKKYEHAEKIRKSDKFWDVFLDHLGFDDYVEKSGQKYLDRTSMTRRERIKNDIGSFAGDVFIAISRKPASKIPPAGYAPIPRKRSLVVQYNKQGYPVNNGALGPEVSLVLKKGTTIDRIGLPTGKYVSPKGVPEPQRSLPPSSRGQTKTTYQVTKDIPGVSASTIAPAYGQPGGGIQYRLPRPVQHYIPEYLRVAP